MPKNLRFWRNVTVIGLAHTAVIVGLVRWSHERKTASGQSIVWMSGGDGGEGIAVDKKPRLQAIKPSAESQVEPSPFEEPDNERPVLTSAPSEIRLPSAKPSPASISSPKPTPKVKAPPKPTPKPKPKPTPKPSPKKMILAKASPKPLLRVRPSPPETTQTPVQSDADPEKNKTAQAELAKNAPGAGNGQAGGAGGESQFGWYGSMLHDRFYSEWIQPNTAGSAGAKSSVLVKIRIERDGRVSNFEIVKPSGNDEVDQSVAAVAKRISQVEPLPAGLGNGDHYDVKINFELNSE